jgi:hypothetical protein
MTTKSLKEKVIQSIESVENDILLESLLNIIELESDTDSVYEFNKEQQIMIDAAKQEIKEGKIQSNEEVNKEIEKWLNK